MKRIKLYSEQQQEEVLVEAVRTVGSYFEELLEEAQTYSSTKLFSIQSDEIEHLEVSPKLKKKLINYYLRNRHRAHVFSKKTNNVDKYLSSVYFDLGRRLYSEDEHVEKFVNEYIARWKETGFGKFLSNAAFPAAVGSALYVILELIGSGLKGYHLVSTIPLTGITTFLGIGMGLPALGGKIAGQPIRKLASTISKLSKPNTSPSEIIQILDELQGYVRVHDEEAIKNLEFEIQKMQNNKEAIWASVKCHISEDLLESLPFSGLSCVMRTVVDMENIESVKEGEGVVTEGKHKSIIENFEIIGKDGRSYDFSIISDENKNILLFAAAILSSPMKVTLAKDKSMSTKLLEYSLDMYGYMKEVVGLGEKAVEILSGIARKLIQDEISKSKAKAMWGLR